MHPSTSPSRSGPGSSPPAVPARQAGGGRRGRPVARWDRAGCRAVIFGVAFGLLFFSWAPFAATEFPFPHPLDHAWAEFLHDAFARGRQFGSEVVFTYGPYGFVATGAFRPETFGMMVTADVLLCLAAALALERLIDRFLAHPVAALGWLLLLAWLGPDPMLLTVTLAAVLAVARDEGPAGPQELAVAAALALVGLIKFNFLVAAGLVTAAGCVADIARRRPPWPAVVFAGTLAVLWVVAGQRPGGVVPFLRNSAEVAAGYNEAMVYPEVLRVGYYVKPFLAVAGLLGLAVALAGHRRLAGLCQAGALAGLCLVVFKSSFIRDDSVHEDLARTALYVLPLLYGPVLWKQAGVAGRACLGGATVAVLVAVPADCPTPSVALWRINAANGVLAANADAAWQMLTGQRSLRNEADARQRERQRQLGDRPVVGPADIYPYRQELLLACPCERRPRPVFQSYTAYTPRLAALNAQHLEGPDAPRTVLFALDPIDRRLPALDDNLSWPDLLTRYDPAGRAGDYVRLERAARPRTYRLEPWTTIDARFGEQVTLPDAAGGLVWARLDVTPTAWHRLAALAYKAPLPAITVNAEPPYRLLPGLARAGFLLSPLVVSTADFEALARGRRDGTAVRTVRLDLEGRAAAERYYEPVYHIQFARLVLVSAEGPREHAATAIPRGATAP